MHIATVNLEATSTKVVSNVTTDPPPQNMYFLILHLLFSHSLMLPSTSS